MKIMGWASLKIKYQAADRGKNTNSKILKMNRKVRKKEWWQRDHRKAKIMQIKYSKLDQWKEVL